MTSTHPAALCACGHAHGDHLLKMYLTNPAPMGLMICPECECTNTWRASTRQSSLAEIAETRRLVRAELLRRGLRIPKILR